MRAILCLFLLALTAGCATTASDEPVFRLRPAPGPEGTREKKYSGNADVTLAFLDLGNVNGTKYGGGENVGLRVAARPSSWFVAPEVGFNYMRENPTGNDNELKAGEVFAGGRVALRSTRRC